MGLGRPVSQEFCDKRLAEARPCRSWRFGTNSPGFPGHRLQLPGKSLCSIWPTTPIWPTYPTGRTTCGVRRISVYRSIREIERVLGVTMPRIRPVVNIRRTRRSVLRPVLLHRSGLGLSTGTTSPPICWFPSRYRRLRHRREDGARSADGLSLDTTWAL